MDYMLINGGLALSLIIVCLLIAMLGKMFYKQYWFGVPFIRTKNEGIKAFIDNLKMEDGQVLLDLGCGDGIVMAAVLDKFPGVIARGFELVPEVVASSSDYQKKYGERFDIQTTDYFKADFGDASVIYCYLLPRLIKPVWEKMKRECKPGTKLYSNVFVLPGIEPIQTIVTPIKGGKDNYLYVYLV